MKNLKLLLLLLLTLYSCSSDNVVEEPPVNLGEEIVSIEFPDKFILDNQKFHVILSDNRGKLIDVKTHSKNKETLKLFMKENFEEGIQFTLTFIEVSEYNISLYNISVYSNLTKSMLKGGIFFQPKPFSLKGGSVNLETKGLDYHVLDASGYGYSMVKINDKLSGHYTTEFNNNLDFNNIFIKYYDPSDINNNRYKWNFTNNISELTLLDEHDFRTDKVEIRHLETNVPSELPLLELYGYENDILFNHIAGHKIYSTNVPAFGFGSNHYYSYANIFPKTSYTLCFSNYSLFGLGVPPTNIEVPKKVISSTFSENNKLTFSGVEGFEVGRVRLDNSALNLNIEFIFNGETTDLIIPEIPDNLLEDNVKNAINSGQLRQVQAIAENYENFNDYDDYIDNVLKTSSPFYIKSPKRERICKSYISRLILPIYEFPHLERFR